jgi:WD40 repeat protein
VRFWNLRTGRLERTLREPDNVGAVAISPDWKVLARAGEQWAHDETQGWKGHLVTLWDVRSGKLLHTLKGDRLRADTPMFSLPSLPKAITTPR